MEETADQTRKRIAKEYRKNHKEEIKVWQKKAVDKRNAVPEKRDAHLKDLSDWRKTNREYVNDDKRKKRREIVARALEIKTTLGCAKCGNKHPAVLDFHHPSDDKTEAIGSLAGRVGWDKLKLEIDKCIVLCSNCHRIHHWEEKTGPWQPAKYVGKSKE